MGYLICFFECLNEVVHILLIPVLYPKILHHLGGIYVTILVGKESLGDYFWCTAVGFEVLFEILVCYDTCLHQAIH